MGKLTAGTTAPNFNLASSDGKNVALSDFKGQKHVVLYFYPKDDTPGCTIEACGFRDSLKKIEQQQAVVLGVSPDSLESHRKFSEKFKLPFLLLSDEDKATCRDYGVWVEKSMYGRKYFGVARSTFIIDKQGKIAKVWDKVTPKGHDEEVLAVLKTL